MSENSMIKAHTLSGKELDHWVAIAMGWHRRPGREGGPWEDCDIWAGPDDRLAFAPADLFHPSTDVGFTGRLVLAERLSVTSPKSPVHRNGGPLNGWGEAGSWGACSWHAGVDGKRAFGRHETEPSVAICRCLVALKLGREFEGSTAQRAAGDV
ncbi:hypothetical protein BKK79_35880 [Cupriavidus sp. USMAA2-4]|uniref:DUF2591 family protein n=1 Tax=Cupriavidus sp. USMAA2-4 TaxID=876364 RepID=UPI0008A66C2F|nr:DUF2591 family protein [Cupriavidus sp. USMAA2-4]AOY96876.1 hypothetical protein BKK79_35880 [Cupriavidus sp. USMAA2-4]